MVLFFLLVFSARFKKLDMYPISALFKKEKKKGTIFQNEDVDHLHHWQSSSSSLTGSSMCSFFLTNTVQCCIFFLFLCSPLVVAMALLRNHSLHNIESEKLTNKTHCTVKYMYEYCIHSTDHSHLASMHSSKASRALNVIRYGLVLNPILNFSCTLTGLELITSLHIHVMQNSSVFNSLMLFDVATL